MNKREFESFVAKILNELWLYAEIHAGKTISGEIEFRWLIEGCKTVVGKKNVIDEIVRLVYVDIDLIYPSCDLNIMELTNEGNLKIEAWIANYEPRTFGTGWSGRRGPFIYCVNEEFISPDVNINSFAFKSKLRDLGLLHD